MFRAHAQEQTPAPPPPPAFFSLPPPPPPDAPAQKVIRLWEKGAPGFEARRDEPEQHKDWWYKNIHNPSLTVFLPPAGKANSPPGVIAAGGGRPELCFHPRSGEP